jgi:hypothetical protein
MPLTMELDTGRVDRDEVTKLQTPLDSVLAYWIAMRDKDGELMAELLNEEKWLRYIYTTDPDYEDMTEEEIESAIGFAKIGLAEKIAEAGLSDDLSLLVDGLSTTWFEVEMDGDDKAVVTFSEEFRRTTGDESEVTWWVEKNEESGLWEVVRFEGDEDDF